MPLLSYLKLIYKTARLWVLKKSRGTCPIWNVGGNFPNRGEFNYSFTAMKIMWLFILLPILGKLKSNK